MSHSQFPNDQAAVDQFIEPEENYTAEHSGDGPPHHHKHHHHHRHEKHEHNEHKHHRQGDSPYTVRQGDTHHHSQVINHGDQIVGDPNEVGTVAHAIEHILAVVRALPYQKQRHLALGHAMSRLIESEHLSGAGSVMQELHNSINRYSFIPER